MYLIFVLSSDQIRALSDDVLVLDRARSSSTSDTGSRFHVPDAGIRYNWAPSDVTVSGKSGIGDSFAPVFRLWIDPVDYCLRWRESVKLWVWCNWSFLLFLAFPASFALFSSFPDSNWQIITFKIFLLPMLGFELRISGVGSNRSAHCATTQSLLLLFVLSMSHRNDWLKLESNGRDSALK